MIVRILADTLWVPTLQHSGTFREPHPVPCHSFPLASIPPEYLDGAGHGVGTACCGGAYGPVQLVYGYRLTTFETEYALMVHNEVLTHKALSRCSSSTRAVPTAVLVQRTREAPFIPTAFAYNRRGMQGETMEPAGRRFAREAWVRGANNAAACAEELAKNEVHKQHASRPLAPYMYIRTVLSATDWANFYNLRCSNLAQPEFHALASAMYEAHRMSVPRVVRDTDLHTPAAWHLPYVDLAERVQLIAAGIDAHRVSVARCARVSYMQPSAPGVPANDGRHDPAKDAALYANLVANAHSSPHEHVAHPKWGRHANYTGWEQHRMHVERKFQPGQTFPDDAPTSLPVTLYQDPDATDPRDG